MSTEWNHNIHYHPFVLSAVPRNCSRALDVGCGHGLLVQQLVSRCSSVTGIDLDPHVLPASPEGLASKTNPHFVAGDVMTYPFAEGSFQFIAAVATLHHLPLEPALARFRALLEPGGVLTLVGLYRAEVFYDRLCALAAIPVSRTLKRLRHFVAVEAPMQPPKETLAEIRASVLRCLPGAVLKRRLLFRYSVLWCKPPR